MELLNIKTSDDEIIKIDLDNDEVIFEHACGRVSVCVNATDLISELGNYGFLDDTIHDKIKLLNAKIDRLEKENEYMRKVFADVREANKNLFGLVNFVENKNDGF